LREAHEEYDSAANGDGAPSAVSPAGGKSQPVSSGRGSGSAASEPDWAVDFDAQQAERERKLAWDTRRAREDALAAKLEGVRRDEDAEDAERRRREAAAAAAAAAKGGDGAAASDRQSSAAAVPAAAAVTDRKRSRAPKPPAGPAAAGGSGGDDEFLLEDKPLDDDSDGGGKGGRRGRRGSNGGAHESRDTLRAMSLADQLRAERDAEGGGSGPPGQRLLLMGDGDGNSKADGSNGSGSLLDDPSYVRPKLYFVSRTHSQVAQFVRELGLTEFAGRLRVVALGGRRQLCVNDDVLRLGSDGAINERCLELQDAVRKKAAAAAAAPSTAAASGKDGAAAAGAGSDADDGDSGGGGTKRPRSAATAAVAGDGADAAGNRRRGGGACGCPFLSTPAASEAQTLFRDRLLATGRDIEDAAALGRRMGTCAYYGSRRSVAQAHIVAMPYTTLLHAGTRDAMGLDLAGSVVVVDEAHNIIDALNGMHSVSVSLPALAAAHAQVAAYLERYRGRLSPDNLWLCTQLTDVLSALVRWLRGGAPTARPGGRKPAAAGAASAPAVATSSDPLAAPAPAVEPTTSPSAAAAATIAATTSVAAPPSQLPPPPPPPPRSTIQPVSDFLYACGCDNVNLFRLVGYVERSQLLRKLRGFTEAGLAAAAAAVTVPPTAAPPPSAPGGGEVAIHPRARASATTAPPSSSSVGSLSAAAAPGAAASASAPSTHGASSSNTSLPASAAAASSNSATGPSGSSQQPGGGGAAPPPLAFNISSVTALQTAHAFLTALTNADGDGRVVVDRGEGYRASGGGGPRQHQQQVPGAPAAPPSLKFVMLNPAVHFRRVVDSARSVILAGGTMQPVGEVSAQLFGHLPPSRVHLFSCGHIIPRDHLLPLAVGRSPSGPAWDFRYASRRDGRQMDDLGRALLNLVSLVPAGVVVFLPSYDFERALLEHWGQPAPPPPPVAGGVAAGSAAAATGGISTSPSSSAPARVKPSPPPGGAASSTSPRLPGSAANIISPGGGSRRARAAAAAGVAAITGTVPAIVAPSGGGRGGGGSSSSSSAAGGGGGALVDVAGLRVAPTSILAQLAKRKVVFREPKSSADLERTLREYAAAATAPGNWPAAAGGSAPGTPTAPGKGGAAAAAAAAAAGSSSSSAPAGRTGALLFSVIGGKMSEGINFSDDLARCVVVVGLPFPNPTDPELRERMAYLDRTLGTAPPATGSGAGASSSSSSSAQQQQQPAAQLSAGTEYYENLCMKAVNQSIGEGGARDARAGGSDTCGKWSRRPGFHPSPPPRSPSSAALPMPPFPPARRTLDPTRARLCGDPAAGRAVRHVAAHPAQAAGLDRRQARRPQRAVAGRAGVGGRLLPRQARHARRRRRRRVRGDCRTCVLECMRTAAASRTTAT
jgi:hypothetical protein